MRILIFATAVAEGASPGVAAASDAGDDSGSDGSDADGAPGTNASDAASPQQAGLGVACDGSLCDTETGSTCALSSRTVGSSKNDQNSGLAALAAMVVVGAVARRRGGADCRSSVITPR